MEPNKKESTKVEEMMQDQEKPKKNDSKSKGASKKTTKQTTIKEEDIEQEMKEENKKKSSEANNEFDKKPLQKVNSKKDENKKENVKENSNISVQKNKGKKPLSIKKDPSYIPGPDGVKLYEDDYNIKEQVWFTDKLKEIDPPQIKDFYKTQKIEVPK